MKLALFLRKQNITAYAIMQDIAGKTKKILKAAKDIITEV